MGVRIFHRARDRPAAANRITSIDYSDATPDVQFAYDPNGNRASMTDGAGPETYTYDNLDQLNTVTRATDIFSYEYDLAGNVTRRSYPDGTVVDYTYDEDGRLSTVTADGATSTYGYDAAGNLTSTTLPSGNGHVEARTYDRAGRLTEVKNTKGETVLSSFTYTLDAVGNPTKVVTPTETTTYVYDALDRLAEVCFALICPGPQDPYIRWTYDGVGNRLTETRPSGTTTYAFNAGDQLTSTTGPSGTTNYTYDANGNQTQAGSRSFSWNLAGRLTSTTLGTETTTYSYFGDGERRQAINGTQSTNYLWDESYPTYQLALERDPSGEVIRRYVHGVDLLSMRASGTTYYYHYDGLGSVANLTSSTGGTQWSYTYEPFGALRSQSQGDPLAPNNLIRFTGELFDSSTGLYHLRARQLDPLTGRFTALDPLAPSATSGAISPYSYVGSRPTAFVDPSGLRGCVVDRSPFPSGSYWDIRSHRAFWEEQQEEGLLNPDPVLGFLQWAGGVVYGEVLDLAHLETYQASWETLATPCTSGPEKVGSVFSILGVAANLFTMTLGPLGTEIPLGRNFRLAPWGNRGPGRFHRPHYHRRIIGPDGQTVPGGGMRWHRPWEKGW